MSAQALKEVVRAVTRSIRAMGYYDARHPVFEAARQEAFEALQQAWLEHDGVTLGAAGVLVVTPQALIVIGGLAVEAVDTTAAGDTFAGALAARLAEGADLVDASRFANAAAAVAVTRMGAQPSVPTRDEITRMLAEMS